MSSMPLALHSVSERGQPNREHIAIKVNAPCWLNQFGITLALRLEKNLTPYQDNCFWFADPVEAKEGDWVYVYTGQGTPRAEALKAPFSGTLFIYYWGRSTTMFYHPSITPLLFQVHDHEALAAPPFMAPRAQGAALALSDATKKT